MSEHKYFAGLMDGEGSMHRRKLNMDIMTVLIFLAIVALIVFIVRR